MQRVQPFSAQDLTSICKILADTREGFTGAEIGYLLRDCQIPDVSPEITKWKRLFNAFVEFQDKRQFGNHVVVFINRSMNPVQYTGNPNKFAERKDKLNTVLSFSGLYISDDGKVRWSKKASSLDDAMKRANRLHASLIARQVHNDILAFSKAELLKDNYFHAIFEAMKSVSSKIRKKTGLDADGANLVEKAFGGETPLLAINPLSKETERGEQRGFANLLKGFFGTVRNPLAHEAKIEWEISEQDALDILTALSLVHRKLDKAYIYKKP